MPFNVVLQASYVFLLLYPFHILTCVVRYLSMVYVGLKKFLQEKDECSFYFSYKI